MTTRRRFLASGLRNSSLISLAPSLPGFLARTARGAETRRDDRILVVVQLDGGNDGINTVVPFKDEGYAKHRETLRLPENRLRKIGGDIGLHPELDGFARLFESGRLAIVQGVGYPNPNRSHFRSMEIWQSARLDPLDHTGLGWIGRSLDGESPPIDGSPAAFLVGMDSPPTALRGRRSVCAAIDKLDDYALVDRGIRESVAIPPADELGAFLSRSMLDAYSTADRLGELAKNRASTVSYPDSDLAQRLRLTARLIEAGLGTRVYYLSQGSYDTHGHQLEQHASLLEALSDGIKVFLDDLESSRLADRVVVMVFSEFGRRVEENGSKGTDHGTAGPVFLAGRGVKAGLIGHAPSLLDLQDGDIKMTVDFRQVYASVLEQWLGLPTREAVGDAFKGLPLFQA